MPWTRSSSLFFNIWIALFSLTLLLIYGPSFSHNVTVYTVSQLNGIDEAGCRYSPPCLTISFALTQVSYGDTIVVDAGIYEEVVTIQSGLGLFIEGSGQSNATVLKCGGNGTGFSFVRNNSNNYSNTSTIYNFTVTDCGIGVSIETTDYVQIQNFIFRDNNGSQSGSIGGAALAISDVNNGVLVSNSLFMNNIASMGAAIYMYSSSGNVPSNNIEITNSTFLNNSATMTGGAIWSNLTLQKLLLKNCTFYNNQASDAGGAIEAVSSSITIENSNFIENYANFNSTNILRGGAIDSTGTSHIVFQGEQILIDGGNYANSSNALENKQACIGLSSLLLFECSTLTINADLYNWNIITMSNVTNGMLRNVFSNSSFTIENSNITIVNSMIGASESSLILGLHSSLSIGMFLNETIGSSIEVSGLGTTLTTEKILNYGDLEVLSSAILRVTSDTCVNFGQWTVDSGSVCHCPEGMQNEGDISISGGSSFHLDGNFSQSSTGSLTISSKSELNVTGNILNDAGQIEISTSRFLCDSYQDTNQNSILTLDSGSELISAKSFILNGKAVIGANSSLITAILNLEPFSNLTIVSGMIDVNSSLIANGFLYVTGRQGMMAIRGSGNISSLSEIYISDAAVLQLNLSTLVTNGTLGATGALTRVIVDTTLSTTIGSNGQMIIDDGANLQINIGLGLFTVDSGGSLSIRDSSSSMELNGGSDCMLKSNAEFTVENGSEVNITGSLLIYEDGSFSVWNGNAKVNIGGNLTNAGTVSVMFGTLHIAKSYWNSGALDISTAGIVIVDTILDNFHSLSLSSNGTLSINGNFTNESNGTLSVLGSSQLVGKESFENYGKLSVGSRINISNLCMCEAHSSTMISNGGSLICASIQFDGVTILENSNGIYSSLLLNNGQLFVGSPNGTNGFLIFNYDGELVLGNRSTLYMDVAGTTPGIDIDQIVVNQDCILAGTLLLNFAPNFFIEKNLTLEPILFRKNHLGTFSDISLYVINSGCEVDSAVPRLQSDSLNISFKINISNCPSNNNATATTSTTSSGISLLYLVIAVAVAAVVIGVLLACICICVAECRNRKMKKRSAKLSKRNTNVQPSDLEEMDNFTRSSITNKKAKEEMNSIDLYDDEN